MYKTTTIVNGKLKFKTFGKIKPLPPKVIVEINPSAVKLEKLVLELIDLEQCLKRCRVKLRYTTLKYEMLHPLYFESKLKALDVMAGLHDIIEELEIKVTQLTFDVEHF